jgi:hypothetical protein
MREKVFSMTTDNSETCGSRERLTGSPSNDLPCPFFNNLKQSCRAGGCERQVAVTRRQLCNSDDHDRCPAYLAYLLRRSRPLRSDCDWLDVV